MRKPSASTEGDDEIFQGFDKGRKKWLSSVHKLIVLVQTEATEEG